MRSLTHHPLVQVMLGWQNLPLQHSGPAGGLILGDLQVTPLPVDMQTARMDLAFSLSERWTEDGEADGIGGIVEFRTDVFDPASVEVMVSRLQQVLDAMTADPERLVSSVDLLDDSERIRLGEFGNRAVLARASGEVLSVPGLLDTWVARIPDSVAVSAGDSSLTYAQLAATSERWARVLAGRGVGPGRFVGLVLSRSVDAIVAIVAVLKSGAAYVPVDPGLPSARLAFVLADAAPAVVISSAEFANRLDGFAGAVIDIGDLDDLAGAAVDAVLPVPGPGDAAYVIYTSGTSGVPKGVGLTHAQCDARCWGRWMRDCRRPGCGVIVIRWLSMCRCGRSSARCCAAAGWW